MTVRVNSRSKTEHVVEAERAVATQQAVIPEQTAGCVANHCIGAVSGAGARFGVEQLAIAEQARSGTRNRQSGARHLAAEPVMQDDLGCADRPPRARRRIDQVAERVIRAVSETQEQSRREAWRRTGIGLRLAAINQQRIEHMRTEARFGNVPAV